MARPCMHSSHISSTYIHSRNTGMFRFVLGPPVFRFKRRAARETTVGRAATLLRWSVEPGSGQRAGFVAIAVLEQRVSQMPADQRQTYNPGHRTASAAPTLFASLRAPRRPKIEINGFLVHLHARARNAVGQPQIHRIDHGGRSRSPRASPPVHKKATVKTLRQQWKGRKAAEQAQRSTTKKRYGEDAYNVSVAPVLTVWRFVRASQSPSTVLMQLWVMRSKTVSTRSVPYWCCGASGAPELSRGAIGLRQARDGGSSCSCF